MNRIVLIGAGQLGSRHLQGLAKCKLPISIEVVEKSNSAINTAKERFEEIKNTFSKIDIKFFNDLSHLSNNIDLAIVATNSNVRFQITKKLILTKKVKNLILEKVLFQDPKNYVEFDKLIKIHKINCWVNHSRRMFPFYSLLKKRLLNCKNISFNYFGGNWGLACNSLHLIDICIFLTNHTDFRLDLSFVEKQILNSKRDGFIEFNGTLNGILGNHFFSFSSLDFTSKCYFTIDTKDEKIIIDEESNHCEIINKSTNEKTIIDKKIVYFQSELSNLFCESILKNKGCPLPTYSESMKSHQIFIKDFINIISQITNKKTKVCPIT